MKYSKTSCLAFIFQFLVIVVGSLSSVSGFYPPSMVDEIRNTIEGVISFGAGKRWFDLMKSIENTNLPPSITIFLPTNEDMSSVFKQWASDPNIIRYHIVPRALSIWELSRFSAANTSIITLLPQKPITVGGDTCSVTLNNAPITHPEMFLDVTIAVHGVPTLLNYSINGGPTLPSPPSRPNLASLPTEQLSSGASSNVASVPTPQQSSGASSIQQVSFALPAVFAICVFKFFFILGQVTDVNVNFA